MDERGMGDFLTYNLYLTKWDQSHVRCLKCRLTKVQVNRVSLVLVTRLLCVSPAGRIHEDQLGHGPRPGHRAQAENALWQTRLGQGVRTSPQGEPHVRRRFWS